MPMRQITRQQNSDDGQPLKISNCSSSREDNNVLESMITKESISQMGSQQISALIFSQQTNIRNPFQESQQHQMDQNPEQSLSSPQFSTHNRVLNIKNNIQVVRPPKNLAQFQICSTIGFQCENKAKQEIFNGLQNKSQPIPDIDLIEQRVRQKSHLRLFSTKTSSKQRTQELLKDMKCQNKTLPLLKSLKIKSLPTGVKRSVGLQPNLQILNKISPFKKICKSKLKLGRIQMKKRLQTIQRCPIVQNELKIEYGESEVKPMEIQANQSNIVVSHIENFVHRKQKKELDKKLLLNMKRQLLRNSVIRQKKVMAANPSLSNDVKHIVKHVKEVQKEKSFLDMTSLWTDQNRQAIQLQEMQRITEEEEESVGPTVQNMIQEDCFSLTSNSEDGEFLSQSVASDNELSLKSI